MIAVTINVTTQPIVTAAPVDNEFEFEHDSKPPASSRNKNIHTVASYVQKFCGRLILQCKVLYISHSFHCLHNNVRICVYTYVRSYIRMHVMLSTTACTQNCNGFALEDQCNIDRI